MTESIDSHFVKSVTHLGDRQKVTNHRDITSDTGLKLVAAGNHITSKLYDKLVKHKLLPPLEQCLSVEDGVDHSSLVTQIDDIVTQQNSPFEPVRDELPQAWREQIIRQIPLPPAMGFKLTVAREERPELFEHSLLLAILVLYLCRRMDWDEVDTVSATSAALLHDIGILHVDQRLFESGHTMSLKERRSQRGGTLSGGEQQMLAIARALMSRPRLLLLDEPSLGLAPKIINQIFEIIEQIRQGGVTIFLVEQNANRALQLADRGYVLETGRLVLADTGDALLANDQVKKAYLGG